MSEGKGKQRRFTAEEKRAILAETEQPGATITAVCRKHRIAATQFYRWRALAEQGVGAALRAARTSSSARFILATMWKRSRMFRDRRLVIAGGGVAARAGVERHGSRA